MTARRTLAALAAASALLVSGALAAPASAHGNPNTPERFAEKVTTKAVMRHLQALQYVADRNGGNRAATTPGYEASAQYVERTLKRAGYTTERDYFTFDLDVVDAAVLLQSTPEAASFVVDQMEFSTSTPETGLTANLSVPANAFGCDATAWEGVDATGTIALVSRGNACPFAAKALAAQEAGAIGVVIYNNLPETELFGTLGEDSGVTVPTAGTTLETGQALLEDVAAGPVEVTLDIRSHVEEAESFNVIAETKRGRDDNVVMLGAHLDSVEDGPGINDNGSGSAALLEVAVQLAKAKKHNNTVRFAWWGAEELGLVGSTAYVDELATQEGELDRIATYLNFDMIGSPNYIIGVYDADQSTYEAPVEVPAGSAETEDVFTDYFDSIGQPWVDTEFSGRSDYQAFILNGIPASGLFTGADDVKTAEEVALFGGTEGITHDPNYHSPGDDITNIDTTALGIMVKAVAFATYSLAQDTSAINGVSGPGTGHGYPGHPGHPGKGRHGGAVGPQGTQAGWERAA